AAWHCVAVNCLTMRMRSVLSTVWHTWPQILTMNGFLAPISHPRHVEAKRLVLPVGVAPVEAHIALASHHLYGVADGVHRTAPARVADVQPAQGQHAAGA